MTFYILPENREKFEKLVARASKHLAVAPTVTFSEPMQKTQRTTIAWKCEDERGIDRYTSVVTVLEVTVDDITSGDWVLVADVEYADGFVGMRNSKYYKDIPAHLGLDYIKCDYCGHTHPKRIREHIVYNTVTKEWKQIGTSCGKKMFEAGDICKFTVDLYKYIEQIFSCDPNEGWGGFCRSIPDNSWKKAYNIDSIVSAVLAYRKEVNPEWEKVYYEGEGRNATKVPGTTTKLLEFFQENANRLTVDEVYCEKLRSFVSSLKNDDEIETDRYNGTQYRREGFNSKIKSAFDAGYVLNQDFYTVFFAVKRYEESLTEGDWQKTAAQFTVGEKKEFRNLSLLSKDFYEDFYGNGWFCKFSSPDGVTITKTFSNFDGFDADFKNEDGTYSFIARVDYINDRKRTIKLGGRVSRIRK